MSENKAPAPKPERMQPNYESATEEGFPAPHAVEHDRTPECDEIPACEQEAAAWTKPVTLGQVLGYQPAAPLQPSSPAPSCMHNLRDVHELAEHIKMRCEAQPVSVGAGETQIISAVVLEHSRSCPALTPGNDEDCTCGLEWRIHLETEKTMHAAWMKRANEAEAEIKAAREEAAEYKAACHTISQDRQAEMECRVANQDSVRNLEHTLATYRDALRHAIEDLACSIIFAGPGSRERWIKEEINRRLTESQPQADTK